MNEDILPLDCIYNIKRGLLNSVIEDVPFDSLQITLDVYSEKVLESGRTDGTSFYLKTDKTRKSNINFQSIADKLQNSLEKVDLTGSGWSHRKINSIDIEFFKEGSLVGHGAYVEWPVGTNGAHKIINIRSANNDRVPLSIAAHFIHDKLSKTDKKNPDRALEHYKQKVAEIKFSPLSDSNLACLFLLRPLRSSLRSNFDPL